MKPDQPPEEAPQDAAAAWSEKAPPVPRRLRALQFMVLGALLLIAFWQFARAGFDWRAALQGNDPGVFFFAMATLPVFGFPISVCYVYAGMAFDAGTAIAACIGGLAINMSASYALTRSFLKEPISCLLQKRGWRIPRLTEENAFRFAFLIRTVPGPPFFFQNLALGLSGMPFWSYLGISLLTQGSIAAGVIYCTSVLSKDPKSVGGYVAIAVILLLLILKSIRFLMKRRRQGGAA